MLITSQNINLRARISPHGAFRRGVPDRATVYKNLLKMMVDVVDPQRKHATIKVSLYEAMALGQIRATIKGNTNAWKEIQDSLFGKQLSGLNFNITSEELKKLSEEELDALLKKLDRGYVKMPTISIIEARQPDDDDP